MRAWWRSTWEWLSSHPVMGGLAPVTGAFAGLLGSLYSPEIKTAFPFYLGSDYGPIVWVAVTFWGSLVIFGTLYGAIVWGQNRSTARQFEHAEILQKQAKELHDAVRTLPGRGFLSNFEHLYSAAFGITQPILSAKQSAPDDIEHTIRVVLDALVTLAKRYDDDDDAHYGANIMVFRDKNSADEAEFSLLRKRVSFADKNSDPDGVSGVLELKRALSTTTETDSPTPDGEVPELVLAIPDPWQVPISDVSTVRFKVLPGAPLAFCENSAQAYANTSSLADWCQQHGDFSPSEIGELRAYFSPTGQGAQIQSFISFPIPSYNLTCGLPTDGKETNRPVGVVNIHRSSPSILRENGYELFVPMTTPFCLLLSQLLERLKNENVVSK